MKRNLLTRTPVIALAAAPAAGTAGCTVTSPFQTAETASLGDGVPVDLDSAQVRNFAPVSGEKGGDATVIGAVENVSGKELTLTVAIPGGSKAETKVPANATVSLSEDTKVTLTKVDVPPGDMITLEVSDGTESTPVLTPVLDPTGYYEDFAPKGWTPTPTPSASEGEGEGH
ncbi:hypothetical protein LP422_02240 [Janibacter limosus]|uniref:Uncharacterized protein n=1 Tax=Janibacter limosus TaxID=53458 RepID=A0AC61U5L8_9MICO|nr:hypothetical protein [Janibacter limosus]UUZ45138.1 hypothetical protein LP422_02240 [Janibacter limosus]